MSLGDEAAFPMTERYAEGASVRPGLSKREYFVAMAMQGSLARLSGADANKAVAHFDFDTLAKAIARSAVFYADALLAELAKGPEAEAETRPGTQSGAV